MPPSVHSNEIRTTELDQSAISKVLSLNGSEFILTASEDGALNIWNSTLRLQKVGGLNVKQKLFKDNEIDNLLIKQREESSEEVKSQEKSIKVLYSSGKVPVPPVELVKAQSQPAQQVDLLYTMFEEVYEPEDLGAKKNDQDTSSDDEDHKLEVMLKYLLDYNDVGPAIQQTQKVDKPAEDKKIEEEEKKVEPVAETKADQSKQVIEPSPDLLEQMLQMGFSQESAKLALIKSKNASLESAIDIIQEVQNELTKTKKVEEFEVKIEAYECSTCTLINSEGKPICEVCGTEAPQSAYVTVLNQEALQKQAEEEEKKKKEQEDKLKQIEDERQRQLLEE